MYIYKRNYAKILSQNENIRGEDALTNFVAPRDHQKTF